MNPTFSYKSARSLKSGDVVVLPNGTHTFVGKRNSEKPGMIIATFKGGVEREFDPSANMKVHANAGTTNRLPAYMKVSA